MEMNEEQFGPGRVYFHGSGRSSGPAKTGLPAWDVHLFVSHDPEVAKLYGPAVHRLTMAPDTRVLTQGTTAYKQVEQSSGALAEPGLLGHHAKLVQAAGQAGFHVVEFHRPHDFVGHVVLDRSKVQRSEPYQ